MSKGSSFSKEVTVFLDDQKHPMRKEIDALRGEILNASQTLAENVKWNGPNYSVGELDRITMKIQPPTKIQLIFHRGAKVQAQPKTKLIADNSGLLDWRGNDRAIATFKNIQEIDLAKSSLSQIIRDWLKATK